MPLDAILLTALRCELENSLLGAKIDRISMPEKDVLILSVHSREQGSCRVLISVRPGSARISLTEQTMENPPQPPMFCMLLLMDLNMKIRYFIYGNRRCTDGFCPKSFRLFFRRFCC